MGWVRPDLYTLASIASRSAERAAANLKRWPEHTAFFDDVVGGMIGAKWVPPLENFQAEVLREGRLAHAQAAPLLVPAHHARELGSVDSTRPLRKANAFGKRAETARSQWQDPNMPEARLSPLQLELRRSVDDWTLHMGPHGGQHHAHMGVRTGTVGYDPLDVGSGDDGFYAWRFAAQALKLCTALVKKLPWIDRSRWLALRDRMEPRSAQLELTGKRRHGTMNRRPPWSSIDTVPQHQPKDIIVANEMPTREEAASMAAATTAPARARKSVARKKAQSNKNRKHKSNRRRRIQP
jgi:hypothetical protein